MSKRQKRFLIQVCIPYIKKAIRISASNNSFITIMGPTGTSVHDDAYSQQQDSCATTNPASARAFWQPVPLLATFTPVERKETTQVRSKSIPMRMRRSSSELQLYQDQAAAEARDYNMFLKVYSHLQHEQTRTTDQAILDENAICMNRLMQTRSRHLHESAKKGIGGRGSSPLGVDHSFEYATQEEDEKLIGGGDIFQLDL